ncbi:hypothetical protein OROMI_013815 [Orobanche minor]
MDDPTYKANRISSKELEDELLKFTTKSDKVQGPLTKRAEEVQKNDVEVNITECTKSRVNKVVLPEYHELTQSESSSSFGESDSDFENVDTSSDSEALANFCGESALDFDGFGDNLRRKKLTAHWRSFIQPIMWRCKWTELQIKKLQTLTQKYDRKLEVHNKRKQIQSEDSPLIDGVKSLPFSHTEARVDLVKRKKRRMIETTTDVTEYMSQHNLFSYYENKKSSTESALVSNVPTNSEIITTQRADIDDEFWANDDLSSFIAGDGDNFLEGVLRKIELLQSQAGRLRIRVDRILSENAKTIFFADNLSLPAPFHASHANNGEGMAIGTHDASQLISECNMGDVLLPDNIAITNHGIGVCNANANIDHARSADSHRNVKDGALVYNRRVKEEMNNFEEVIINPIEKPPLFKDVSVKTAKPPVPDEPNLHIDDQPPRKIRSVTTSKRKRGRKKSARLRTRRTSG